jgi:hypothetical protein
MKLLNKNKRSFYYATYAGIASVKDDKGYDTGEHKVTYNKPQLLRGTFPTGSGEIASAVFGMYKDYDGVIILDSKQCPVTDTTILFINCTPQKDEQGNYLNDYVVKKVVPSPTKSNWYVAISTVGAKKV